MGTNRADGDLALTKIRLDYAWRYLESAARQRMLFFNYYLIIVGILANAFILALRESLSEPAIGVCVLGVLTSIAFRTFDCRCLKVVDRALRVLETLERESLFPDGYLHKSLGSGLSGQLGLARIEPDEDRAAGCVARARRFLSKQKIWIRLIELAVGLGFLLAAFHASG